MQKKVNVKIRSNMLHMLLTTLMLKWFGIIEITYGVISWIYLTPILVAAFLGILFTVVKCESTFGE